MPIRVLIAHARGEESCAEELAVPLRKAGFDVAHEGTVLVGDSVVEEASRLLRDGGPVVLCGTIRALGTKWARTVVSAARLNYGCRTFCVKMDEEADVESVSFDEKVADYWQDPASAVEELITALRVAFPADEDEARLLGEDAAEARYRRLALESCDIVDLANLPESERHLATRKLELRRLYVPLSVVVEAPTESDELHGTLDTLEQRRQELRGWSQLSRKRLGSRILRGSIARQRVPLGERLGEARRLVVLGDPGAGKTTLLRWLATAYLLRLKRDPDRAQLPAVETLPDEEWLPVIIRCRDLPVECVAGALDDILGHTLRKAELTATEAEALRRLIRSRLQQGRALLLIDGLDEIAEPALRSRFAQQVEQVHVAFPSAPIVVTSRIVGYRDMGYRLGRGFEHLSVAEFEPEEKNDFARRWCALTELPERKEAAIKELISDIHSTDRIERLTGNPMLLTTMALVKRKIGRLPSRRADLYWEALQVLLNWRPEVDLPIDHREAVPQLEYIAFEMCNRAVQQIREDQILDLLNRVREDYPRLHEVRRRSSLEFLKALEARTGILINTGEVRYMGRPVPLYEFRHLTFQEYLAGLALVDGVYPDRTPSEELSRAISRISGYVDEVEKQDGSQELVTAENWREAVRLAVANAKYDEADDVLQAVLSPQGNESGTERPRAILAALCLADEPRTSDEVAADVMQGLAGAVDDQDRFFRTDTALHSAASGVMISHWGTHLEAIFIDEFLRRSAPTRTPVGHVLGTSLIRRLEEISSGKSVDVEAELQGEGAKITLFFAASANGAFARTSIFPRIVSLALDSLNESAVVAHAAMTVLHHAALYGRRTYDTETFTASVSHALTRFWNDAGFREVGLMIAGVLQLPEFRLLAVSELDSDYPYVRRAAARALGRIGGTAAVSSLINHLDDEDPGVREAVTTSLGTLEDVRALTPLIDCLGDSEVSVREAIAQSLGMFANPMAVEPLITCLADEDTRVRSAAVESLGMLQDARAVEPLQNLLADPETATRAGAIYALGSIAHPDSLDRLIACVRDEDYPVRQAAVFAVAEFKDERVVDCLLQCLSDDDAGLQNLAAYGLGNVGSSRAVEPLLARLRPDDRVANSAASALGQIKDTRATQPLLDLLCSDHPILRPIAAQALGGLGDPAAVDQLRACLDDSDESVRKSALGAITSILGDELDRTLVSRDLDGIAPYLDPHAPLTVEWMRHVKQRLSIPEQEIEARYRALADEYGIVLPADTRAE